MPVSAVLSPVPKSPRALDGELMRLIPSILCCHNLVCLLPNELDCPIAAGFSVSTTTMSKAWESAIADQKAALDSAMGYTPATKFDAIKVKLEVDAHELVHVRLCVAEPTAIVEDGSEEESDLPGDGFGCIESIRLVLNCVGFGNLARKTKG